MNGDQQQPPKVTLIDELLSPDSSRFWSAESYEVGKSQDSYDKQFVRGTFWFRFPFGAVRFSLTILLVQIGLCRMDYKAKRILRCLSRLWIVLKSGIWRHTIC